MSALSDSGFEEDLHTSPAAASSVRLTSDLQECDYEESCFIIQRHNELQFLAQNCLARQPQITAEARSKLVSWLIAVHKQLKLSFESCCLAVNIMDRFLITTSVAADCFQLLGVTSLLIATKQVEVYSPRITQLLSLCCNSFSREQLCNLECLILLRLNFRLAAPTLAFFLDYFTSRTTGYQTDGKWKWLACKVCELSLADYTFNKYMPSVIVLCSLESFCFQEYPTFEAQLLFQQCTEDLKLLVSLNQDAVQDFLSL
uniref:Cyclin-O protein B-like n=1 Tax=Sinocyclocheilus anshuiensis TaxID=1608454 RepID=A0A671QZI1_9TELE